MAYVSKKVPYVGRKNALWLVCRNTCTFVWFNMSGGGLGFGLSGAGVGVLRIQCIPVVVGGGVEGGSRRYLKLPVGSLLWCS